jgi:hypothetical protein
LKDVINLSRMLELLNEFPEDGKLDPEYEDELKRESERFKLRHEIIISVSLRKAGYMIAALHVGLPEHDITAALASDMVLHHPERTEDECLCETAGMVAGWEDDLDDIDFMEVEPMIVKIVPPCEAVDYFDTVVGRAKHLLKEYDTAFNFAVEELISLEKSGLNSECKRRAMRNIVRDTEEIMFTVPKKICTDEEEGEG